MPACHVRAGYRTLYSEGTLAPFSHLSSSTGSTAARLRRRKDVRPEAAGVGRCGIADERKAEQALGRSQHREVVVRLAGHRPRPDEGRERDRSDAAATRTGRWPAVVRRVRELRLVAAGARVGGAALR